MQRLFSALSILFIVTALFSCKHASNPEITAEELKVHISYLASDSLKGREPGTEGDRLAAEYIRDFLKESGLELAANNGFQYFDVVRKIELGENNSFPLKNTKPLLKKILSLFRFHQTQD